MRSVLSTSSLPPKTASKDTTKRKEPSSSRTQVSPPSKRSKSQSTQPTSADAQSAVVLQRDTTVLAHSSQKDVAIETRSKSLEHPTRPRTKHLQPSSKRTVKDSQRATPLPVASSQKDVAVEQSHQPMTYIESTPQTSSVPSQKETVVIRESSSLFASSQQDVDIEKGHQPMTTSEHGAQTRPDQITLHPHTESRTHDAQILETAEEGIGEESIAAVLSILKHQRRQDLPSASPSPLSPVVRPSPDVLTSATTPVVEVASHASTQEPTTGGSPTAAHVPHEASLGHTLDVLVSSSVVPTPGSDDTPQGLTTDPLSGGNRLPEQTTEPSAPATGPPSDDEPAYEHDTGFEVHHPEDSKSMGQAVAEIIEDEATEEPDEYMSQDLAISLNDAKRMVRQDYLAAIATSSSYSGLSDIAEEINNKYKATVKNHYVLISGLAKEVEVIKNWQEEARIEMAKRDLAAALREATLKRKVTTLEAQMSDVLKIAKTLQQQQLASPTTAAASTTPAVQDDLLSQLYSMVNSQSAQIGRLATAVQALDVKVGAFRDDLKQDWHRLNVRFSTLLTDADKKGEKEPEEETERKEQEDTGRVNKGKGKLEQPEKKKKAKGSGSSASGERLSLAKPGEARRAFERLHSNIPGDYELALKLQKEEEAAAAAAGKKGKKKKK